MDKKITLPVHSLFDYDRQRKLYTNGNYFSFLADWFI